MAKRIRGGDPQRRRYWEEVLRRWRQGEQTVRVFCRSEGVRESAFYFWRRKLDRHADQGGAGSRPRAPRQPIAVPSFLPVQVVEHGVAGRSSGVEIVLEHGRSVRVQTGFDRQTLADVLAVLEVRPC
jgi:transposase-like protein